MNETKKQNTAGVKLTAVTTAILALVLCSASQAKDRFLPCKLTKTTLETRKLCKTLLKPPIILSAQPEQGASKGHEIWPFPRQKDGEVSILLMGDTNISYRDTPQTAFEDVKATLLNADIVFANLEGPFAGGTDDPLKSDAPGKDWRHSNPNQIQALLTAGFTALGTANNVTLPPDAAMRGLNVLKQHKLLQTGSGRNKSEAEKAVIIDKNGVRVGIIQRTTLFETSAHAASQNAPGVAVIPVKTKYELDSRLNKPGRIPFVHTSILEQDAQHLQKQITALKKEVDIVLVSFHWGLSDAVEIVGYERDLAHLSIDAGADFVFGHGSHRFKPIEVYKGRAIVYDAGQSIFDDRRNFDYKKGGTRSDRYPEGLLVRVRADKNGVVGAEFALTWRNTFGDDKFRLYTTKSDVGGQVLADLKFRSNVAYKRLPITIEEAYVSIDLHHEN